MSYLYIKKFIDDQILILNQPLVVDENLQAFAARNNINPETIKAIVFKANAKLKRNNRSRFNKQVVHQIVQQIVKNEKDKLFQVNEALAKIDLMIQPVLLPDFSQVGSVDDRIRIVSELVSELPEPEYLFAVQQIADEVPKENVPNEEIVDENILVHDEEERVDTVLRKELEEKYRQAVNREIKEKVLLREQQTEQLKKQYSQLRQDLLAINKELIYNLQKLEYLRGLEAKLNFLDGSWERGDSDGEDSDVEESNVDLAAQIRRFKILVEKLAFAMK